MHTKIIGIALALTMIGGVLALARDAKLQSANSSNVVPIRMDGCPYYPSPVFCHSASRMRMNLPPVTMR
jgi:hypothetical protein